MTYLLFIFFSWGAYGFTNQLLTGGTHLVTDPSDTDLRRLGLSPTLYGCASQHRLHSMALLKLRYRNSFWVAMGCAIVAPFDGTGRDIYRTLCKLL